MQDLKDFKLSSASGGSPVSSSLASAAIWLYWTGLNDNYRMDVECERVCVSVGDVDDDDDDDGGDDDDDDVAAADDEN